MSAELDRPVWHALIGRQRHLAVVQGAAVRIDPTYGVFAAAVDRDKSAQAALAATLRDPEDGIGLVEREPWPVPPGLRLVRTGELVQMIYEGEALIGEDHPGVVPLHDPDAAEMAALAHATEPGPWAAHTHGFGAFYGMRIGGQLAAMAGERLLLRGWAEVSGVCTWPEFRGQGLAAALVRRVIRGFFERGDRPFLHCYADNVGAIRLYEAMGFRLRAPMVLTVLALA